MSWYGPTKECIPQIETYIEDIPLYGEAYTYFRVARTPLVPVIIEGSTSRVTRGWGQIVEMNPSELSIDPDDEDDKVQEIQTFTFFSSKL